MVSHAAPLVDVHPQPAAMLTVTVPEAPVEAALVDAGEIVGTQDVPAWVTVNVLPATVTVPVRGVELGFAATE